MYTLLFLSVLIAYLISAIVFVGFAINRKLLLLKTALFFSIFGFFSHSIVLLLRAVISKFPPMSNLYESMSLFAWAIVLVFLIIEYRFRFGIIGAFIMPVVFLITGYASLLDSAIKQLPAALQSYWLTIHVLTCFLSYACFTCAFSVGIMYLLQERQLKLKHTGKLLRHLPALDVLDKINYNMVLFGFVLLTAGIVTGSIWALQAWGRPWGWDPKETAALVTWLIYAAYLHARFNSGWKGRRTAVISIIGFISVLFTYLGVSFLLEGKHSYL